TIKKIKVFFDILLTEDIQRVLNILRSENTSFNHEIIFKYPIKGYNETKKKFLRVYTKNNNDRLKLIELVKDKYETYSDDETSYYRKAAREYGLHLTKWNIIRNYSCYKDNLYVDISYIELYDGDVTELHEKILIMAWDIETITDRPGELPLPQYDGDEVWMIGIECFLKNSTIPIAQICLSTRPLNKPSNWIVLICKNQTELLLKFAECIKKINPDIITGYNTSGYDWP